jgi:cytochrome P450
VAAALPHIGLLLRALPSSSRFIARWDDVRDALERPDEFPTIYAQTEAQLVGGKGLFPLGASGGLHGCLRARLETALDWPGSAQPLANHAGAVMREAVGRWTPGAPFDAIGWFHAATMAVMRPWLGLGGGGVSDEQLAQWAMTLFEWQFAGLDGRAADEARAVAGRMQAFVDDRIRVARQGSDGTFLAAVLKACPKHPERVRAFVIGTAVAALPQLPIAAARALNQLVVRPVALGQARDALARDGEGALWKQLREALRFDPVAPALRRHDHRGRGRTLLPLAAMHDGRRVPHPSAFEAGRDASAYLIFGCGPHACVAAPLVERMLPALIAPILRHSDVRRHGGMHCPGLAPERLDLVRDA